MKNITMDILKVIAIGKNNYHDGAKTVDWIFILNVSPSEFRSNCKLCSCDKYDPTTSHKAKYFEIDLAIFIAMIIIIFL